MLNLTKCMFPRGFKEGGEGVKGEHFRSIRAKPQKKEKTEEKAKVVTSICWEELIKFLAAPAYFAQNDLRNRMNSSFSFKSSWCNSPYNSNRPVRNSQRGKELKKFCPPAASTTFAFSSVFILLLYGLSGIKPYIQQTSVSGDVSDTFFLN